MNRRWDRVQSRGREMRVEELVSMALPSGWRNRWRRRNDPHYVRSMFWLGLRHGTAIARAMAIMLALAVIAVVVWQGLQGL